MGRDKKHTSTMKYGEPGNPYSAYKVGTLVHNQNRGGGGVISEEIGRLIPSLLQE